MLVVPDEGERILLDRTLKGPAVDQVLFLGLYKNDVTPNRESTLTDFDPADYAGYVAEALVDAGWSDAVTVGGAAQSTYGDDWITFLSSAGMQDVYGYYVFDPDRGVCWAERFGDAPFTVTTVQPVLIRPVLRGRSEFEPAP